MNTIREAVALLQQSIAAAMPDMEVSVNISLQAKEVEQVKAKPVLKAVKKTEAKSEVEASKMIDAKDLKMILNAFMKKVGKDEAIKVVKKFTPKGTVRATDIPESKYNDLLKAIASAEEVLEIKGEAA